VIFRSMHISTSILRYQCESIPVHVAVWGLLSLGTAVAQSVDGRWAMSPFACDGEAATRAATPLLVETRSVRWFDTNCTIATSYKVNQTLYLQGRCNVEGRAETISIMLERRGDRLRVGWNREPVLEMQRCIAVHYGAPNR
jgi:hypothetical protein